MSILVRWNSLVEESDGRLPRKLKPFQYDTISLLESGKNVLVTVPTGQGKSLIQLNASRIMGGEYFTYHIKIAKVSQNLQTT